LFSLKNIAGIFALAGSLLTAGGAYAQLEPFTVLSNNTDKDNRYLYVELMYQKPACGDYQAMFMLKDRTGLIEERLVIDSVMNNPNTYQLEKNELGEYVRLMRPQAGGYRLRFDLRKVFGSVIVPTVDDGLKVLVESYKLAYFCAGCGSAGADVIFEPRHVKDGCPYNGDDVLACTLRKGTAANWEAWIQDSRDCKPYRIVQMPDGRWWFAQNLNYQKDLEPRTAAAAGGDGIGSFWCPGAQGSASSFNGNVSACDTYGALYTWKGMMSLDGRGLLENSQGILPSMAQGVCPPGWYVPSYYDWAQMLNASEDNDTSRTYLEIKPIEQGKVAGQRLKATIACGTPAFSPPPAQGLQTPCATADKPAWTYYLDLPKVVASSRFASDFFGFRMIAAGRRTAASFDKTPGTDAYYWTSTELDANTGMAREFGAAYNGSYYGMADKGDMAYSVRCIKN
jgi:uncharacterized protein (TIGR02145 family)